MDNLHGLRNRVPISVKKHICFNEYYRKRLQAVEMDYLRRSARVSRLQHVNNQEIRTRMNAEESKIDRIKNKCLTWLGHVLRMEEERWPKQLYQWKPPGKGNEEDQKSHGEKK
jgi:hypothetical protein